MDLHQVEGYSYSESGNMQQQNRQTFRMEPTNMTKSVSYSHAFSLKLHSEVVLNMKRAHGALWKLKVSE